MKVTNIQKLYGIETGKKTTFIAKHKKNDSHNSLIYQGAVQCIEITIETEKKHIWIQPNHQSIKTKNK